MTAAIDYQALRNLPDDEKAKVAKILLGSARTQFRNKPLALVINNTTSSSSVDFWRVSSTDQRDGFSLGAQKKKAIEYSKASGLKSMKSWSVSESASREFDRKRFFEMIDYVMENGIKNVIFDKIDRACRGLRAAVMIEDLIDSGVCFHFVRDNLVIDRNASPSEKLRFYLGVVLAKWYIDNLKSEIKKGLSDRLDRGYYNQKAPVGYVNIRLQGEKANLVIHEKLGPFIAECFELYKTGNYSRKDLEKHGIERKMKWMEKKIKYDDTGECKLEEVEKFVTDKSFEKLLSNPTYCQYKKAGKGRYAHIVNAKWPALISFDTFIACQKIKGVRAKQCQLNLSGKIAKPLMQLMTCGECRHAITGEVKNNQFGKTYIYYHCANKSCSQRRINTEQKKIISQLSKAFVPFAKFTPKATTAFIKLLSGRVGDLNIYTLERVKALRETQKQIKDRIREIESLEKKGLLGSEEVESIRRIKKEELEQVEIKISAYISADKKTIETGLNIIELLRNSHDFMQLDGFELQKARLYKSLLSNLVLKDGTVEYSYEKPFDDLSNILTGHQWWTIAESNLCPLPCQSLNQICNPLKTKRKKLTPDFFKTLLPNFSAPLVFFCKPQVNPFWRNNYASQQI